MKKMNKARALKIFRLYIAPGVREKYGRGDSIAMREEWNNWTDDLCKNRSITAYQDRTWSNPF